MASSPSDKQVSLSYWSRIVKVLSDIPQIYDLANLIMSIGSVVYVREIFKINVRKLSTRTKFPVLDAGCGPGSSIKALLESLGEESYIIGLDPLTSMLEEALRRHGNRQGIELVRGVFEALPFRDGSISTITFSFSFRDAINYFRAAKEAWRVAREGAAVLILDLGKPLRKRIYSKILEGPYMLFLPAIAGAVLMGWRGITRYIELRRTYTRFMSTPAIKFLFQKIFGKAKCYYMLGGAVFILEAKK
ncbi:MAG: class I SAM-dependent methyltransferase [Fervidicoccaceae archaeon]